MLPVTFSLMNLHAINSEIRTKHTEAERKRKEVVVISIL